MDPAKITFETEDKGAGLPIVASQHAADNAIRLRTGLGDDTVVFDARAAPELAKMSADINSGPIIGRRGDGGFGDWRLDRHIGRGRALRDSDGRDRGNKCDQYPTHERPPIPKQN